MVWFYVLNHSKYRFLFHAIYIEIMNGIRKPAFHAARYNRLKYLGSDVRSSPHRGLVLAPTRFNIAPGTALFLAVAARHPENFGQRFSGADFCCSQTTASCTFVGQRYSSLCKAGSEYNRSHFIIKRIVAEEFVVVRRDPSKVQFVAQLNDFYFQFQKLANNYNQIVKVINAHFSNVAIPHQIALLEQRTRELKTLSIEILNIAKQAKEWLRI